MNGMDEKMQDWHSELSTLVGLPQAIILLQMLHRKGGSSRG